MNTTENNKLIAEFMGYRFYKHLPFKKNGWQLESNKDTGIYLAYNDEDLKYHSSWDWLMLAYKKCMTSKQLRGDDEYRTLLIDGVIAADIEDLYKAVVEFIKWYKENL